MSRTFRVGARQPKEQASANARTGGGVESLECGYGAGLPSFLYLLGSIIFPLRVYHSEILAEDDPTQSIHATGPQLRRGDRLAGRFVVVQFLARGGMGEVYEAADEHLQDKHCALKTLRAEIGADPVVQQRFEREVLLAREVNHPNVCPTYDIFRAEEAGGLFLTMKLLRGESLRARLKRPGRLDAQTRFEIARQMSAGLDAAHRAGVVHRDFKPGNVMLEGAGEDLHVSITDFGLSRLYESDHTLAATGRLAGTIGYIAPELLKGRIATPAADVYAYGAVLHEMLTGQRPSNNLEKVPPQWLPVVRGCLESDPETRFQSAGEALSAFGGSDAESRAPIVPKPTSRRAMIGVGTAIVAEAGAIWLRWPEVGPRVNALLHPLPEQRFVALLAWPPEADTETKPLLRTVLDAIDNQLTRAEAVLKKFAVIVPSAAGQPPPKAMSDVVSSLGANLVLGASLHARSPGYWLALRVFDAASGAVLRKRESQFAAAGGTRVNLRGGTAGRAAGAVGLAGSGRDGEAADGGVSDVRRGGGVAEPTERQGARRGDRQISEASRRGAAVRAGIRRFVAGVYTKISAGARSCVFSPGGEKRGACDRVQCGFGARCPCGVSGRPGEGKDAAGDGWVRQGSAAGPWESSDSGFQGAGVCGSGAGAGRRERIPGNRTAAAELLAGVQQPGGIACSGRRGIRKRPMRSCRRGRKVAPRVALPMTNLGTAYLLMHKEKDAEDAFRRSLERAPNEPGVFEHGVACLWAGRLQESDRGLRPGAGAESDKSPQLAKPGRQLRDGGRFQEADGELRPSGGDSFRLLEGESEAGDELGDALVLSCQAGTKDRGRGGI